MADLIIKPNSATGDKLILQDRAGGAVLTTASSGLDSSTSIVATKTGTETLTNKTLTTPTIDSIKLTPGNTPSSPAEGQLYYDSNSNVIMIYNGNAWAQLNNTSSGGTITSYTSGSTTYRVHTFLTSGTFTPATSTAVDYLIVAGGGAGGNGMGGGGGAGGLIHNVGGTSLTLSVQSYSIVIGNGGAGTTSNITVNGSNTTAFGLTAIGGGGATSLQMQRSSSGVNGAAGGSGGGSGASDPGSGTGGAAQQPGSFSGGYGNAGGNCTISQNYYPGGGGGGAGAAGQSPTSNTSNGGNGGAGLQVNIDGNNYYYAGGGGGDGYSSCPLSGAGGIGGGGAGSNEVGTSADGGGSARNSGGNGTSGADKSGGHGGANTGSGGGGATWSTAPGGNGGSGIVIVRYTI